MHVLLNSAAFHYLATLDQWLFGVVCCSEAGCHGWQLLSAGLRIPNGIALAMNRVWSAQFVRAKWKQRLAKLPEITCVPHSGPACTLRSIKMHSET